MNMKYQRGRSSFFSTVITTFIVLWFFGFLDNEEGNLDISFVVGNVAKVIEEIAEVIDKPSHRLAKPSEATQRAAEAQSDNIPPRVEDPFDPPPRVKEEIVTVDPKEMEPEYISNRIRDTSKTITIPLEEGYIFRRHIDGTLWGCRVKDPVCYPVSD